jgi:aryl-alcohol dehydrogenase-like predicted oxidoreductase
MRRSLHIVEIGSRPCAPEIGCAGMIRVMQLSRRQFVRSAAASAAGAMLAGLPRPARGQTTRAAGMPVRTIPSSGESIPCIGMGTWQTFDVDPSDAEAMDRLAEVLQAFYDAGGRVIDSSPMYGHAETVVGTLSKRLEMNGELFLATKVWTRGRERGIEQMEQSMGKLGRDRLELMQVHNLIDVQTHLHTLRDWQSAGRVRYVGITHYQADMLDELERLVRTERLDFVQLPYSVDFRDAERRLLPAAREAGTAVLVMRPFGGGTLFQRVRGRDLPEGVRAWASSWAQAFLKFILAHDAVTVVLPATSKPHHMADNMGAGAGRLPTEDERKELIRAIES